MGVLFQPFNAHRSFRVGILIVSWMQTADSAKVSAPAPKCMSLHNSQQLNNGRI